MNLEPYFLGQIKKVIYDHYPKHLYDTDQQYQETLEFNRGGRHPVPARVHRARTYRPVQPREHERAGVRPGDRPVPQPRPHHPGTHRPAKPQPVQLLPQQPAVHG